MDSKLSIIVPIYNVGTYLGKCIDSILNQTYVDWELILVDDGSTDGLSARICDEYAGRDNRIKAYHKKNGGLSDARNYGIEHSNGDYLTFVDSDDWIENNMYEAMINAAIQHDADIVVCGHRVVTPDGSIEETVVYDEPVLLSGKDATVEILKDEKIPSFAWNKIYKAPLFNDVKFPVGRLYEDTAVIYRYFALSERVYILNQVYYNYLRRPGSICLQHFDDEKKQIRRLFDNVLAFYERYVFARSNSLYKEALPVCALKSINLVLNLLHYCAKLGLTYCSNFPQRALCMLRDIDLSCIENLPIRMEVEQKLSLNGRFYYFLVGLFYKIKK